MRRVIVLVLSVGSACMVVHAADAPAGRAPRSHIQPVGEIVAERAAPWAGLVTTRAPEVLREQFRLERGAGLVVESVAPGSVAERAGLKRYDVLVSVDGQLLVLPEQFVTLLESSGHDAPLDCRVLRGGIERTLSLRQDAVPATAGKSRLGSEDSAAAVTHLPDGTIQQRDADYTLKLSIGGRIARPMALPQASPDW